MFVNYTLLVKQIVYIQITAHNLYKWPFDRVHISLSIYTFYDKYVQRKMLLCIF